MIDADCHVIETERTWEYLEGDDRKFRPVPLAIDLPTGKKRNFWFIGGRMIGGRDRVGREMSQESREMTDVSARIRHMDEMGTAIQILYPTLFLRPVTDRPDIELALCRSYNRWLADIWSKAKDRLRWVMQPPLLNMDQTLDEMRWASKNGAVAVLLRGLETHHPLHNPYFFPFYEEACRLNMAIAIHSGIGSFVVNEALDAQPFITAKLIAIGGFHAMIVNGILERFPTLRLGIIEVAAQWIPYVVRDLEARLPKMHNRSGDPNILRNSNQLFVSCQTNDDLPYILQYAGENCLMIGSDYGHHDSSSELLALQKLKDHNGINPAAIDKILTTNPARFYGLERP